MLPSARSGRPGHLRLASAGVGVLSIRTRRSGSSFRSCGVGEVDEAGSFFTSSTEPITLLGR